MTRGIKNVAAPAPIEAEAEVPSGNALLRDEFAMRAMAAIVGGVVARGGLPAVSTVLCDDSLLQSAYDLADSAMRVRAKS